MASFLEKVFGRELHSAAAAGDVQRVQQLVLDKPHDIDRANRDGQTALHLAAAKGFDAVVRELLAREAKTTLQDNAGRTPLLLAAKAGHTACVAALLGRSNRDSPETKYQVMTLKDGEGHDPLMAAVMAGKVGSVKELLEALGPRAKACVDKSGCGPFIIAAKQQHVHLLPLLASAVGGPDSERDPFTGGTALHLAAAEGTVLCIQCLLNLGASTTTRDNNGRTAAEISKAEDHKVATQLLKGAGSTGAAAVAAGSTAGYDHRLVQSSPLAGATAGVTACPWGLVMGAPGLGSETSPSSTSTPYSRFMLPPAGVPLPAAYPKLPEGAGVFY